ncbi:hypothetical protein SDC9_190744 [bioreactor metagenome]|uniref:Uncharacterized protein n=1 Tax=bioreactor metagenome TaxID=1076179 RepID=A0A645HVV2_9ZZZZ
MSLDDVPAEAARCCHRSLQVDLIAGREPAEGGAAERLGHDVNGEGVAVECGYGEAGAVHGDRAAGGGVGGDESATDGQHGGIVQMTDLGDLAELLNDAGKHVHSLLGLI